MTKAKDLVGHGSYEPAFKEEGLWEWIEEQRNMSRPIAAALGSSIWPPPSFLNFTYALCFVNSDLVITPSTLYRGRCLANSKSAFYEARGKR